MALWSDLPSLFELQGTRLLFGGGINMPIWPEIFGRTSPLGILFRCIQWGGHPWTFFVLIDSVFGDTLRTTQNGPPLK